MQGTTTNQPAGEVSPRHRSRRWRWAELAIRALGLAVLVGWFLATLTGTPPGGLVWVLAVCPGGLVAGWVVAGNRDVRVLVRQRAWKRLRRERRPAIRRTHSRPRSLRRFWYFSAILTSAAAMLVLSSAHRWDDAPRWAFPLLAMMVLGDLWTKTHLIAEPLKRNRAILRRLKRMWEYQRRSAGDREREVLPMCPNGRPD